MIVGQIREGDRVDVADIVDFIPLFSFILY
jgi:hypothetical protein